MLRLLLSVIQRRDAFRVKIIHQLVYIVDDVNLKIYVLARMPCLSPLRAN